MSVWSRSICAGIWMSRYLDEQVFRFNARGGRDADRFVVVARALADKRLTYQQLIGEGDLTDLAARQTAHGLLGRDPHGCASAAPSGAPSGVGAGWSASVSPGSQSAGALRGLQGTLWPEGDAASWSGNLPHDAWIRQVCYYPSLGIAFNSLVIGIPVALVLKTSDIVDWEVKVGPMIEAQASRNPGCWCS